MAARKLDSAVGAMLEGRALGEKATRPVDGVLGTDLAGKNSLGEQAKEAAGAVAGEVAMGVVAPFLAVIAVVVAFVVVAVVGLILLALVSAI